MKYCWSCKHLEWDTGCANYSEYTPGREGCLMCERGHFNYEGDGYMPRSALKKAMEKAESCPDFEEAGDEI